MSKQNLSLKMHQVCKKNSESISGINLKRKELLIATKRKPD